MKEEKDSYYFPHDANTRNDPKIMALLSKYGVLGYGRFWIALEMLRDQKDYRLRRHGWIISALALAMQCSEEEAEEFIEDCIVKFELFVCDGESFWSESLIRRMEIKDDKKKKRAEAGQRGAVARWGEKVEKEEESNIAIATLCDDNGNAMRLVCDTNAKNSKEEESKVKERKEEVEEEGAPPTAQSSLDEPDAEMRAFDTRFSRPIRREVIAYCLKQKIPEEAAEEIWRYYQKAGWRMGKNQLQIADWRIAVTDNYRDNYAGITKRDSRPKTREEIMAMMSKDPNVMEKHRPGKNTNTGDVYYFAKAAPLPAGFEAVT